MVALYLKSAGWRDVRLSPGSRGPADIIASHAGVTWFIQVKASSGLPRLKGREISRLRVLANERKGIAVISTLQPLASGAFLTGNYALNFYEIESWRVLDPAVPSDATGDRSPSSKNKSSHRLLENRSRR